MPFYLVTTWGPRWAGKVDEHLVPPVTLFLPLSPAERMHSQTIWYLGGTAGASDL